MRSWFFCLLLLFSFVTTARAQLLHDVIHAEIELQSPEITILGKTLTVSVVSHELPAEFTGIALQGFTDSDSLSGSVRFLEQDGIWGEWQAFYIVRSATDNAFLAAYRGDRVLKASSLEIRFAVDSSYEVRILSAGTFDQRLDDEDGFGQSTQKVEESDDFLIRAPHIRRRTEWGAQPFRGTPIPLNRPSYDYMTLHHTAGFAATTLAEGLEQVRRIQDFHQNGRGWSDIGYQFLMDQEGRLYQGRPFLNESEPFNQGPRLAHGAHAGGANTGNIGISLMGCYHPPEGARCRDEMTFSAIDSLVATFGFMSERYEVPPDNMRGHRDFGSTACPGDNNYRMLSDFMMKVEDLLLRGNNLLGGGTIIARLNQSGIVGLKWEFTADYGIDEFVIRRRERDERVTEITRGKGAVDGSTIDLPSVGQHIYELVALNKSGQQQRLAIDEISVGPEITSILAQSFPNPTSNETTIRYFLEGESGVVSLEVFDLNGRLVMTGKNQHRDSGQWYVTTLDASTLPGGVYLYRILVDGFASTVFRATKPLIVLR
ncbi:MAG: N-acetylmuramoyl-L-alanine amidase [Bacteroidota bacterium]|nr:N-acetylmuramoyl-L-alanine amidase [Bacteroidota bacterium]MDE2646220.1 N-acetylmuramoyl-L-alanine amidase [Bacteroidota bacterium]